jgi:hypothetical protein
VAPEVESILRNLASSALFPQLVGALQVLVGALLGGFFVLKAQRNERRDATRGAARALALEMMGNYIALRGFYLSRSDPKFDKLDVSIPELAREVYQQHLPRIAQELAFDDLNAILHPYAMSRGAGSLLSDRLAKVPQRLSPGDIEFLKTISQLFLLGFKTIMRAKFLEKRERLSMEQQLSELSDIEERVREAITKKP